MKRVLITVAASLSLATAAMAGGDKAKIDANGDGTITKAEHDAAITASWTEKDKDRNGQLTATEAGVKADDADWKAADTNGDGYLSSAEYTAKKSAWFAKADSNSDGSLSKTEHDAAMAMKTRK